MDGTVTEVPSEPGAMTVQAGTGRPGSVTGWALAAAGASVLLPTAYSASVASYTFTPKMCVLLVVAGVGLVPLARLVRSSSVRWVVRAAVAFLVVALVSALLSHSIDVGFFGAYSWGTGWLFWLGCAGAFAIGASLRPDQLNWAFGGIAFGAAVNAVLAVFQAVVEPTGSLALFAGTQADGLLGNPIHLEALLLGALALVAGRATTGRNRAVWLLAALLFSVGIELTLERVAVPILVVILAGVLVVYGIRRGAPFVVVSIVGYVVAYVSKGSGLGTRVTTNTASTTYGTRLHIWNLALESVTRHPLFGVGPGQVVSAIAPYVSAGFAHHLGPNTLPADSHDFIVEVVATTGLLGLITFVAWLGGAALKARGPFLICAATILAVELVEPLNVGVTPIALLALGAATVCVAGQPTGLAALRAWRTRAERQASDPVVSGPPVSADEITAGPRRRSLLVPTLTALLMAAGLFLGITMVIGDHYLLVSYNDVAPQPKIATAKEASALLPYWSDSAESVAQAYLWAANFGHSDTRALEEAASWYETAGRRFGADPTIPGQLGTIQLELGNRSAAEKYFRQSLAEDPWTFYSLEGLGTIAHQEHDWRTSLYWYRRALQVAPPVNDLDKLIAADEAHL